MTSLAVDAKPWERQGTEAGDEITGPDGGRMVWVPAGEFTMGSTPADVDRAVMEPDERPAPAEWFRNEHPAHPVRITKGFWLGKCLVTNAQYQQYCSETGAEFPEGSNQGGNHPVTFVTWDATKAYCDHYGLALPTEAQWEYAARGSQTPVYPWGNEWDAQKCCNCENRGPGTLGTMEVGSIPAGDSWCGASDMAGNLFEWCQDWFAEGYYATSPDADPPGPDGGDYRVLRGGSSAFNPHYLLRSAYRGRCDPDDSGVFAGIRGAVTP